MNKSFLKGAASAIAVAITATASPALAQRTEVGNAAAVVGDVTYRVNGEGREQDVERKERFAWGDLIETGKNSQLQILLLDRSSFGVGARTQLQINEYVYDPDAGRNVIVDFFKGALRFFSGRQEDGNSGEVNTPAGRIGIRGTAVDMLVGGDAEKIAEKHDFVGKVDSEKDEATLVLLRGPGQRTEGGLIPGVVDVEGAGVTVTLTRPGFAAYIPRAGAAPIGPFRISDKRLNMVQEELAPEVARANSGGGLLEALIPAAIGAVALGVILSGDGDDERSPNDTQSNDYPDRPQ